jgi:hypothetical protein
MQIFNYWHPTLIKNELLEFFGEKNLIEESETIMQLNEAEILIQKLIINWLNFKLSQRNE